jgi:hypothetical protein
MSRSPASEGEHRPDIALLPERRRPVDPFGPTGSVQEAEVTLGADLLERLWQRSYLERLARSYWRYLRRMSLGLIRVVYTPHDRSVVLLHRRLVLLRFRRPEYEVGPGFGQVTWPIERGLLVAYPGRGFLRISVRRLGRTERGSSGEERLRLRAEVSNFYPLLRGRGRFARLGAHFYAATQLRIHVIVMHGFLRSLADFELPPS